MRYALIGCNFCIGGGSGNSKCIVRAADEHTERSIVSIEYGELADLDLVGILGIVALTAVPVNPDCGSCVSRTPCEMHQ